MILFCFKITTVHCTKKIKKKLEKIKVLIKMNLKIFLTMKIWLMTKNYFY